MMAVVYTQQRSVSTFEQLLYLLIIAPIAAFLLVLGFELDRETIKQVLTDGGFYDE